MEDNSNNWPFLSPNMFMPVAGVNEGDFYNVYSKTMPPGIRFRPTDQELILHYLRPKLEDKPLPVNRIKEINLYSFTPLQLSELYDQEGEDEMFFFTSTDKKYANGSRPSRSAGTGYWKASGADRDIISNGVKVGAKKVLVFHEGSANTNRNQTQPKKTNWIMYEFKIPRDILPPTKPSDSSNANQLDKWVLCKVYERKTKQEEETTKKRKRSSGEEESGNEAIDLRNLNHSSVSGTHNMIGLPDGMIYDLQNPLMSMQQPTQHPMLPRGTMVPQLNGEFVVDSPNLDHSLVQGTHDVPTLPDGTIWNNQYPAVSVQQPIPPFMTTSMTNQMAATQGSFVPESNDENALQYAAPFPLSVFPFDGEDENAYYALPEPSNHGDANPEDEKVYYVPQPFDLVDANVEDENVYYVPQPFDHGDLHCFRFP